MPIITPPVVNAIDPTKIPNRTQDQVTFTTNADFTIGKWPEFQTQINAVASNVDNNATEAFNAATSASSSATTATTQAGIATTQAGIATTRASEAEAQASGTVVTGSAKDWASKTGGTVAGGEYSAKHYSQQAALLTEKYLGSQASDPTVDGGGNPITAGDWYVNTVSGLIRAYNGSAWVNSVNVTAGVTSLNGNTGALTGFTTNTGVETLTNKTVESLIINNGYTEEINTVTTSGSVALAPTTASIFRITANGAITFTDSIAAGQSLILGLTTAGNTINWPTMQWTKVGGGGTAPTLLSSGINWIVFWDVGGTLYASYLGATA